MTLNDDTKIVKIKRSELTFKTLKKTIYKRFHKRTKFFYVDSDGDKILIANDSDLNEMVDQVNENKSDMIRIKLRTKHSHNDVPDAEARILETMLDAIIVSDKRGGIRFMNKAALSLFGLAAPAKRITQLMPVHVANNHQGFIEHYLKTGKSAAVGKTREVIALHSNGREFPISLSITETKTKRRHSFTSTIRPSHGAAAAVAAAAAAASGATQVQSNTHQYDVYESLLDAIMVINGAGTVLYSNRKMQDLLGFSQAELVGQSVNKIMLPFDAKAHDGYMRNYLSTGIAKIIGTGRKVVAQCKNGEVKPVHLTVTEQRSGPTPKDITFTSLVRLVQEEEKQEETLLQVERNIVDNLAVPALVIDDHCVIQAINSHACQLFGYTFIEIIGKNVKMLCNSADAAKHDSYVQRYVSTRESHVIGKGRRVSAARKNGQLFDILLTISERTDDEIILFTAIVLPV